MLYPSSSVSSRSSTQVSTDQSIERSHFQYPLFSPTKAKPTMKITILFLLIALLAISGYVQGELDEEFENALEEEAPDTEERDLEERELWPHYKWYHGYYRNRKYKKSSSSSHSSGGSSSSSSSSHSTGGSGNKCRRRKKRCCDCWDSCKSSHTGGSKRKHCFSDDCENKCERAADACSGYKKREWKKFARKKC
mmetsp:Transcript_28449/g.57832  ORF Transcript_28449/g.57832 Transcript_28449/m.57832 type:complete len:194 (+) Transcript_28449:69-650(+)